VPSSVNRTTDIPFRDWPLGARVIERLYRWTHGGQIRTLVVCHGPSPEQVDTLARYNAERSRGIVHSQEWVTWMAALQAQFDRRTDRA